MSERETSADESDGRWIIALQIEIHGPEAPAGRGAARHLCRQLSQAEMEALNERLRTAAEGFLGCFSVHPGTTPAT